MEVERRRISKDQEKDILIGMITNTEFLKQITPIYKEEYFVLPYARTVSKWVLEYYEKYEKAPDSDIGSLFEQKKLSIKDNNQTESISTFLEKISERHEDSSNFNVEYNVDKAEQYFNESALDLHIEKVKFHKNLGDYAAANAEISKFKRPEKGVGCSESIWCDEAATIEAIRIDDEKNILVKYPGDLGKVIRPLRSEDFIAFIGPPKRGKSFELVELAILASLNRKNVLFVTLEMPAKQLRQRILQRITGEVIATYSNVEDYCEVEVPYFDPAFNINQQIIKRKERKKYMTPRSALRKMEYAKKFVGGDNFRIISASANTMTEWDLERHLDNLEHYDGFIPQVILVDYADIMKSDRKEEHRHQIDRKWQGLRRIGQERKCLMVTVSHTTRETLNRDCRESDLAEDTRKLNHLTMCIAINQMKHEKAEGFKRLSVLMDRFEEADTYKEAVVTYSLKFGAIYLDRDRKSVV